MTFLKGYKFTITRSIGSYPSLASTSKSLSLLAKIPACILGCNVFTLPSIISLNPVNSETSMTFEVISFIALYVPPVERIFIFFVSRKFISFFNSDLSDRLINAVFGETKFITSNYIFLVLFSR